MPMEGKRQVATEIGGRAVTGDAASELGVTALVDAARWAWEHPHETEKLGRAARAEYLARFSPETSMDLLMDVYDRAAHAGAKS